jgi:thiamine kinase-like enzyme
VLPRSNEAIWKFEETMYKFHVDVTFISNRVKRGNALSPFCPNTIMVSPNIYCYKFIHGNTLSKENAEAFSEFLNFCKSFWVINDDVDIESRQTEYLDFYKVKSERRISDFLAKRNPSAAQSINNWSVKPLESLLENVNWHLLSNIKLTRVHGDLHHENVIKCGQRDFKFLDWRSDMAGYTDAYGDPYYDLAKIMHGIIVSHEVISSDRFSVHESHGEVELRIESRSDMKELLHTFIRFLHFNNYEIDRVLILTALIYLNIASLHHDPYDKFLFYLGHVLLQTSDDLNSFMAVLNTLDDKNSLI